jgi:hypothetical protein
MEAAQGCWLKVWYQISLMEPVSRQRWPTPWVGQLKKNRPATRSAWRMARRWAT